MRVTKWLEEARKAHLQGDKRASGVVAGSAAGVAYLLSASHGALEDNGTCCP